MNISGKPLLSVLVFLAAIRYLLAASFQFGGGGAVQFASGTIGLVLGLLGFYSGLALLLEDVKSKTILPVFRMGSSKQAMEGNIYTQLDRLQQEAGVREKL